MSTEQIKLKVNTSKRVLEYDGTLILGVKGDNCAQRVFFECPKYINEFIDDLTSDNITVFVDYKNAYGEPYIQECSKPVTFDDSSVTFSWIITKLATAKAGNVSFNICIKKTVDGELKNEWHTTNSITGRVLDSVDVSKKTPEVITPDTVTIENLTLEVAALKSELVDAEKKISDEVTLQVNNKTAPVYVTGQSIFTTNLKLFNTFTMSFYVDKKAVTDGITYFYYTETAGQASGGNNLGFVTYADLTESYTTTKMHYTIKGTCINSTTDKVVYNIEIITGDENGLDNMVPDSWSNLQIELTPEDWFSINISSTATNMYLVGRKF